MTTEIQYDLFDETTELDELREEINSLRTSHEKVRKGMFHRLNDTCKLLMGTVNRLEKLERESILFSKQNKILEKENQKLKLLIK
jgi:hypothetical protein